MKNKYQAFFGLGKEPFGPDISAADILQTSELTDVKDRFDYVVRLGAVALITGEVGSGKSTALRYAVEKLHPSEYRPLYIIASSGSILEFYKQFVDALDIPFSSNSKAIMVKMIKKEIMNLVREKKLKIVLIVDEASLMRLEVFAELHTICQFEKDSKPYLPMILSGQSSLIDKLTYRSSQPLASRIVAKSHLEGADIAGMEKYLKHHLFIAGMDRMLFEQTAVTAIHQGSGGLFRKANHLARGALIAAAQDQSATVNTEHVRIASTEIF
ncbi:MAG: AAA family ATPase [Syntrophales bacterium]|nr:AAA family ATPase [Syntrophales bacterium]